MLFSAGKLSNGPVYQLINLVGGLSIAVNVAAHHAIPSTVVNGIWSIVALVVLIRTAAVRRSERRGQPHDLGQAAPSPAVGLAEPPATTAVLRVVGPALRDHGNGADPAAATVNLPAATAATATSLPEPTPVLQIGSPAGAPPAPMTETVPVITATIALALVAAAHQQHEQHEQEQQQEHQQHDQLR
ncbi:hypothetical protein [Curtobacterium sp. ISL-83]|uniref:hypothetical protein n=1 Tax=Curtobacterium sp. ISL-83 TaxID=2819145 RepID=UPI001BE96EC2|nr:hypothetical protein [Curtobacterium sp. ISL-83]MBT2501972.1 hypothetical protein [Curtobacterium sp. ISL-83]